MSNPLDLLAVPAFHLVSGLTALLEPAFGPPSTAIAIVLGTIVLRLLLVPAGYAHHRADQRRSQLAARVTALREKFQHNKRRLETELLALYRAEQGSIVRSFLPMLVQAPFFAGLYRVFTAPTLGGHTNALLQHTLFGVPLSAHLYAVPASHLLVFAVLLGILAVLGFASSRLLRPAGPRPPGALGTITLVAPFAPMVAVVFLPLAGSLFLVTTTAWTIAQTVALRSML